MKSIQVSKPSSPRKPPKHVNLQVVARIRPMTVTEIRGGAPRCLDINTTTQEVVIKTTRNNSIKGTTESKAFTFNKVYGPSSTQETIFEDTVSPCLDDVMKGYSCTLFAYGQTGTGKTYTMEGFKNEDNNLSPNICSSGAGIIPRSMHHLFERLERTHMNFTIRVSMLELYNEKLIDLLNSKEEDLTENSDTLKIYENPETGTPYVGNLTEIDVVNRTQVFDILAQGSAKRTTAATQMNAHSSRSHCIFQAVVNIQQPDSETMTTGRLYLVDLAGSENIGRSGAKNIRAKEAGNINKSLLTLGRVINLLVEKATSNAKINHIPYRDSQLTRLLQNALGGKSKTTMIITLSPSKADYDESMSSLEYGHRAQNIKNRPEVTETRNVARHVEHLNDEIKKLQSQLILQSNKAGGIMIPLDRKLELEQKEEAYEQLVESNIELEGKHSELVGLLDEQKGINSDLKMDLKSCKNKLAATEYVCEKALERSSSQNTQATQYQENGLNLTGILKTANEHIGKFGEVCDLNDRAAGDFIKNLEEKSSEMEVLVNSVSEIISECENCLEMYSVDQLRDYECLERINNDFSSVFKGKMVELDKNIKNIRKETDDCSGILKKLVDDYKIDQDTWIAEQNIENSEFCKQGETLENEFWDKTVEFKNFNENMINSGREGLKSHRDVEHKFHEDIKFELDTKHSEINNLGKKHHSRFSEETENCIKNMNQYYENQKQGVNNFQNEGKKDREVFDKKCTELDDKYRSWLEKNKLETEARHTDFLKNLQDMMIKFSESERKASEMVELKNIEHLGEVEKVKDGFLEAEDVKRNLFFGKIVENGEKRVKARSEEIKEQLKQNEILVGDIENLTGKLSHNCQDKMKGKLGDFLKYEASNEKLYDDLENENSRFYKNSEARISSLQSNRNNWNESNSKYSEKYSQNVNNLKTEHNSKLDKFSENMKETTASFDEIYGSILKQENTFISAQNDNVKSVLSRSSKLKTDHDSKYSQGKQFIVDQNNAVGGIIADRVTFTENRKSNPGYKVVDFNETFDERVLEKADRIKFELDFSEILKHEEIERVEQEKIENEKKLELEKIEETKKAEVEKKQGVVDENEYLIGIEEKSGFFENFRKSSDTPEREILPESNCSSSMDLRKSDSDVTIANHKITRPDSRGDSRKLKKDSKPDTKPEIKNNNKFQRPTSSRPVTANRPGTSTSNLSTRRLKTQKNTVKTTGPVPVERLSKLSNYSSNENLTVDNSSIASGENSPRKYSSPGKISSTRNSKNSPRKFK